MFVFFFSSRRRHTRSYGDWSSDVCSSDLGLFEHVTVEGDALDRMPEEALAEPLERAGILVHHRDGVAALGHGDRQAGPDPTRADDHDPHQRTSPKAGNLTRSPAARMARWPRTGSPCPARSR